MSRYIDAQKLKDAMNIEDDANGNFNIITALKCVDDAPTADVQEVRHGKWIYCGHHEFHGHVFECSVCGRYLFANSKEDVYVEYPYCHCGAKMDEEEA